MNLLHISDLHFEGSKEQICPGVSRSLEKVQHELRQWDADLAVVTGDLTTNGCVQRSSLEQAKEWLDGLRIPYIAIPGNHDSGANLWRSDAHPDLEHYEPVPFEQTNFGTVFKQAAVVTRELANFLIIGLALREDDPDNALVQLNQILESTAKPIILCGHYPVVPAREEGVLERFPIKEFIPHTAESLRNIINNYGQIKMYLCGHIHINSVRKITKSCWQMSAGSLGQGASVYRLYSISNQGIHYETLFGAGPLSYWSRDDIAARDPFEYHLGTANERFGQMNW